MITIFFPRSMNTSACIAWCRARSLQPKWLVSIESRDGNGSIHTFQIE